MASSIRIPGFFITGTDTNVGKTFVATLLARQFAQAGKKVGVYKPVASGCRHENGEMVSDDAIALWEAAGRPETLEAVCPQRYLAPLAPNVAAEEAGCTVDETLLRTGFEFWRARSELLIVEGAGGLLSPVSGTLSNADLAVQFGLPLVIVAANRLGVINHTLLTVQVAQQYRDGLKVLTVILNQLPGASDPSYVSNFVQLATRLSDPKIPIVSIASHQTSGITHFMELLDQCNND